MKQRISFVKVVVALIPSVLLILILINQFPYTGLARIVSIPMILVINILIIALGLALSLRLGQRYLFLIWGVMIILTLSITLFLYPQENAPNVIVQLWEMMFGNKD